MNSAAHPILSCADALAWEKKILGGEETREWSAMSRAGRAIARAVLEDAKEIGGIPEDARLLALCGKGHNGGDALIALHALLDARPRASAQVYVVPGFAALRPLARRALEDLWRVHHKRVGFVSFNRMTSGFDAPLFNDVCLDGLFGMQFRPPLSPVVAMLLSFVDSLQIRLRVAIDLPSGISDACDEKPFRADFTYATGIAKTPLFAPENTARVGRVRYLDLGFFDFQVGSPPLSSDLILTPRVLAPLRALRDPHADKRTFGHLFVVSGSRAMPGAVFMSVKSALLSGAGLVTAFVPESLATEFAAQLPEAMWVPMPETPSGGLALEGRGLIVARAARCTALLAGPGLGRDAESLALITELLRALDVPTVLDADALQHDVLAARSANATSSLVLTPHAGEFERIAGNAELAAAARQHRATIVLKGAPTRVSDGGAIYISSFGGPVLARGGSGDVLAGMLGAQLAQGASALEAATRAVVWHGRAADCLARAHGQTSARVTQLCDYFSAALAADDLS